MCKDLLLSTTPAWHDHQIGSITYCKSCPFKLIADHNNVTFYSKVYSRVHSTKCWCKDKANQETTIVKTCKKTNTISYSSKHCLNSTLKLVNHIYVYPTKNERDDNIFYICPKLELAKSIPSIHDSISCKLCNNVEKDTQTIGLVRNCYDCKKNQLTLFTAPHSFVDMDTITHVHSFSGITWQCSRCYCTNINFFKDSIRQELEINCSYCNY